MSAIPISCHEQKSTNHVITFIWQFWRWKFEHGDPFGEVTLIDTADKERQKAIERYHSIKKRLVMERWGNKCTTHSWYLAAPLSPAVVNFLPAGYMFKDEDEDSYAKFGIFGHIWHIWADTWARQIWSSGVYLKISCKMQFRRVGLRSIGPSSQKLWPNQIAL